MALLHDYEMLNLTFQYYSRETRLKECFQKGKKELAVDVLQDLIKDQKSNSLNSWKTALYQSIIDSEWYWNEYLPEICKGKD